MRIAVIGLGVMGRNHKRVLERLGHEVVTVDPAGHADTSASRTQTRASA
jgi:Trk K+ transport system NAD-binding subunit